MLKANAVRQSFLLSILLPASLITPLLLVIAHPLSLKTVNHLPAGPTSLIFALLAQYHAAIPTVYKYKINTTISSAQDDYSLVFSDKSMTYLLAAQLALSSVPGSTLAACVGWALGVAWREEWGPAVWGQWRLPGWTVGESKKERREGFEGLRRRMEGEGRASGSEVREGNVRRRGLIRGVVDQFRGAF